MERREALIKTSWILKSAFLTPALFSILQSCQEKVSKTENLFVLNDKQNDLIKAIADCIIPRTKTPSASDVRVNTFIDLLLADVFDKDETQKFLIGLDEFDETCQSLTDENFIVLSERERSDYLEKLDTEVMGNNFEERVPFYYAFKYLVVTAYFSTEEGMRQNLNYTPVPGPYKGEIEYVEGSKIMIGNRM